jgi:hypothetical protein
MEWYNKLYVGSSVGKRSRILQYKISNRKMHPVCYLIVMVCKPGSLLEIIPSSCLLQEAYPTDDLSIIGIAGSRQEARELAAKILSDVYEARHDLDVKAFLYGGGSL